MKKSILLIFAATALALSMKHFAAEQTTTAPRVEYVTIRWAGKDNTHIIRPGGQVEFVGPELRKATKPSNADDRAFYMNLVMNGLTKDGFEFAGMSSDEIVMKRLR